MSYQWKEQVVLITGAAAGIGAEVTRAILEEGVKHVAILDINVEAGLILQNELNSKHGDNKTKFYECDVTNEEKFLQIFATVKDEYDYIDVVINNAGIFNDSLNMFKKEIEINLTALVLGTFKAIEMMRKDKGGRGGTVINVSSVTALVHTESLPVYSATKSAVLQFSNCIGMNGYYSRTGVRVLTICFGATDTAKVTSKDIGFFDPTTISEDVMNGFLKMYPMQSTESAARGLIDVYKNGKSASTWVVNAGIPALDITSDIQKAYEIMSSKLA